MIRQVTMTVLLLTSMLTSCGRNDVTTTVYMLPSELPGNIESVPQFACEVTGEDTEPHSAAVLGLRGTEPLTGGGYSELPFLRIGIYRTDTPGIPQTPEEAAAEAADPGSARPATVGDNKAISFTMTTAEPRPVAHPALAWQQDNVIITMLGKGFTLEVVLDVAESLEPVTREEFLAAGLDKQGCDQ